MKRIILLIICIAFFAKHNQAQTITDYDGNVYQKVTIGSQVWLKPNLKVTHFNNGDTIPNVTDATQWNNLSTGAYCNYDNSTDTANIYGRLYNFYVTTDSRNVCPSGWHVPNNTEIIALIIAAGNTSSAGGNMKETGFSHWFSPNTGANNSTGFTAIAGGERLPIGFGNIKSSAYFWTSYSITGGSYLFHIDYDNSNFWNDVEDAKYGFSIRCMQAASGIDDNKKIERTNVYPIPAKDRLYIDLGNNHLENVSVSIFNTIGDRLLQKEISNITNEIDISSLAKGLYFIKLSTEEGSVVRKFVKE